MPISKRKQYHLDICSPHSGYVIESALSTQFSSVQFLHKALPEISVKNINATSKFLGHAISFPFFVSCMTGGARKAGLLNRTLARACQKVKIPLGLGSMRVLFDEPERIKDFQIKKYAPDIPVMANISAVQVRDIAANKILDIVKKLEAQALVIHCNCGQEIFQEQGDRDFQGLLNSIGKMVKKSKVPVTVKETGFGIHPGLVVSLLERGVKYVDIAGAGGTNWILVEQARNKSSKREKFCEFSDWGIPTAPLVAACKKHKGRILASGGLRSGRDVAKAMALGAHAAGMALPLLKPALTGNPEEVVRAIKKVKEGYLSCMLMTGSRTNKNLRNAPLLKNPEFIFFTKELLRLAK